MAISILACDLRRTALSVSFIRKYCLSVAVRGNTSQQAPWPCAGTIL